MQKRFYQLLLTIHICLPAILLSAGQKSSDPTKLSSILVTSDLEEDGSKNYYKTNASSVTRTDTPLFETSQSVQIVTQNTLSDLNVVKLDDTLDYVSGISRQNNFGGVWDNFAIRGFAGHENSGISLLRNGFADNRGYNAPRDAASIESIEFLKGPSGSLYGNTEPGGTINVVTKKPKFISENNLEFKIGSNDFYRVATDFTGSLSDSIAYRLNLAAEKKKSSRNYIQSERYVIAPALLWNINDTTQISYNGEYIRQDAPLERGIVAINEDVDVIDHKLFFGNPDDGDVTLENYTHQLKLEQKLSENWSSKIGLAYKTGTLQGIASEVKPFVNVTTDSVKLRTRYRDYDSEDFTFQVDVKNTSDIGSLQNTLLLGVESYRYKIDSVLYNLNNSIQIDNLYTTPTYTKLSNEHLSLSTNKHEEQKAIALFAQDELSLSDSLKILVGLRYDDIEMNIIDYKNNTSASQNNYALSPRAGITYIITPSLAWYATSGSSFRPNSGVDINGNSFDPEEGISFETGLKFESEDKNIGATISLYKIDKKNVLTASDPDGKYSIAAGEVGSTGLEFDINGKINENIKISANYAYTKTEVTKDTGGIKDWATGEVVNLEGKALSNIPKHSGGLFLMWENYLSNNSAYGIGSNILYTGERKANYINSFTLDSYITVGLNSYWQATEDLKFSFNISNLFDEEYIASSYDRSWLTPGSTRSYTLSMAYKF